MGRNTSSVTRKLLGFSVAAAGLFTLTVGPLAWVFGAPTPQQPSAQLVSLGYKFEGAAGCSNANCHGNPKPNAPPKPAGNEYLTWAEGTGGGQPDKHSDAYKTLTKPDSAKITQALGLKEKPDESPLCTGCHALVAPPNLQMSKFNVKEGVTCNACHGPYEKWEKPHNQPGGADGLRKQCGYAVTKAEEMPYSTKSPEHQKLLKEFGLYDTRPVLARAEKCTSCHLAIDSKLIEAGHPQPIFELAYYTSLEPPHWREPGGFWGTKVWAAGQVICLRDAMNQLAERATTAGTSDKLLKDAYNQAMGHLGMFKNLSSSLDGPAGELKAAANDKAKMASTAKAIAAIADKLATGVAEMKPTAGNTAGLLKKISADAALATDAGLRGAQQQALGLASLAASMKKGSNPGGIDDVQKMIDEKLLALVGDEATFKPGDFTAALKDVAAKLGPMTGNVEAVDLK